MKNGNRNAGLPDNPQGATREAGCPSNFVSAATSISKAHRDENSSTKGVSMRSWNLKEAKIALEWASTPEEQRPSLKELAKEIRRSPKAILNFLRRQLPPGQRPWPEKPRWRDNEAAAVQLQDDPELDGPVVRSAAAIRKYKLRNLVTNGIPEPEEETYSVTEIAGALGLSRRTVYRMLARGQLRRWKGGVSEASFLRLVREHPELIPYAKLTREHREWLVLNGFLDPTIKVKTPSSKGLLNRD